MAVKYTRQQVLNLLRNTLSKGEPIIAAGAGGTIGVETAMGLEEAAVKVQEIIDAAKAVNPDVIPLSHGGPIATPDDDAYINQHTDAVGFVGASSIERYRRCQRQLGRWLLRKR